MRWNLDGIRVASLYEAIRARQRRQAVTSPPFSVPANAGHARDTDREARAMRVTRPRRDDVAE
jgi:hypothetical protein